MKIQLEYKIESPNTELDDLIDNLISEPGYRVGPYWMATFTLEFELWKLQYVISGLRSRGYVVTGVDNRFDCIVDSEGITIFIAEPKQSIIKRLLNKIKSKLS